MKLLTSILILIASSFMDYSASAKTLKVAIIDTGAPTTMVKPCSHLHKDFTGEGLPDINGHGTNIAYLVDRYAGKSDYCQIYLKYYVKKADTTKPYIAALRYALVLSPDVIVIAATGTTKDKEESCLIKTALDSGVMVVAAAGNNSHDLDMSCNAYPACLDDRIIKAVCVDDEGNLCPTSNYGTNIHNLIKENGFKRNAGGWTLTGTSQATGVAAGKLIKYLSLRRKK